MTAAVIQGVPSSTIDTDLWLDLPKRFHARAVHAAMRVGAEVMAPTVVGLPDETVVNFVFEVHGLREFEAEYRRAVWVRWHGRLIALLPLESILKSKEFLRREKDLAHIPLIKQAIRLRRRLRRRPPSR